MDMIDEIRFATMTMFPGMPPERVEKIACQAADTLSLINEIAENNLLRTMSIIRILDKALETSMRGELLKGKEES